MSQIRFPEYTHLPSIDLPEASLTALNECVNACYRSNSDKKSLDSMQETIEKIAPLALTILTAVILSPLASTVFWVSSWVLPNLITVPATMLAGAVLQDTINHIWTNLDANAFEYGFGEDDRAESDISVRETLNKAFAIGAQASYRLAISGKDFIQSSSTAMTSWITSLAKPSA
ncbi:MAG: hypothetical protein NTZ52_01575 [Chlamydiae bacterium]|nr:hypothetical protein [Chlamydiota bacterium]